MNTLIRRGFVGYVVCVGSLSVMLILPGSAAARNLDATQKLVLNRFFIQVPAAPLALIADRVRSAHFPKTSKGAGGRYGVDALWFKQMVDYWRDAFDRRAAEAPLNRTEQFLASIEGLDVHFARLEPRSGGAKRPPLLLLHGWPHTFASLSPILSEGSLRMATLKADWIGEEDVK
jgi:Epoxide hydrolase N terminus